MKSAHGSSSATIAGTPSLASLFDLVNDEMALVEDWLKSNLIDDNAFVEELLKQIFHSGGKRIRPLIVLISSKATARESGKLGRLHIILAVLTELIHTASLVHDDVIDKSAMRRGQETINKRWNDRIAVLMGDLLFAQASICLSRIMNPVVVGIYGQVLGDLCSGEIKQMRQQFVTTVDWNAYIDKSVSKTASLFAAGSHSGAILNGCSNETIQSLKDYGLNLGICFQIVDDLLDITGSTKETGKAVGGDLRNGVITAPAMFVLEKNDSAARRLKELIDTREIATADGSLEALELIKTSGGIDETVKLARRYANLSTESISHLKDSEYKDALVSLVEYVMTRTT
ncbi:MAG: polyprenyl synthetase family protein [Candidatus Obscuribacterales bacterium]|nr:polyprenyl synthetase family protein [Candidatus Obscuribacterales bacterium]